LYSSSPLRRAGVVFLRLMFGPKGSFAALDRPHKSRELSFLRVYRSTTPAKGRRRESNPQRRLAPTESCL
jgi:hypothetical protein